jgi:metal-responsive CopG/Arc/MetJ family transcriptional regulator
MQPISKTERTSIILSENILATISQFIDDKTDYSQFIESVLREYLAGKAASDRKIKDSEILDMNSEYLNEEAEDVLSYQENL